MFRKTIKLFDENGKPAANVTVSELKEYSAADLAQYLLNSEALIKEFEDVVQQSEVRLMGIFMYPSLEATRAGMYKYADGSVQRGIDQLNASITELDTHRVRPAPAPQSAQSKQLMEMLTDLAKKHVALLGSVDTLKQSAKILNSLLAEKELVVEEKRSPGVGRK